MLVYHLIGHWLLRLLCALFALPSYIFIINAHVLAAGSYLLLRLSSGKCMLGWRHILRLSVACCWLLFAVCTRACVAFCIGVCHTVLALQFVVVFVYAAAAAPVAGE
jgi:hypothetical protein